MAGVTQKSCEALFPLWSLKKKVFFFFCGGSGRADIKISTETYEKFRVEILIRSHVSMMTTVTIIVISVITKIKNSHSNNSDY